MCQFLVNSMPILERETSFSVISFKEIQSDDLTKYAHVNILKTDMVKRESGVIVLLTGT